MDRLAVVYGQTVKEENAEYLGHLLAGHRSDHALEYGGEPRRLHSAEALRQWTERGITRGEGIKGCHVGAESE
jgi:hypothetical protein